MANIKLIFILFIFFNSCNYYSQEKSNNDVQKETSWANTDEYPSTNDCDSINDKNLRIINAFNLKSKQGIEKIIIMRRIISLIDFSYK